MKILHLTDRWITGGGQEHIYRICEGFPNHHFVVLAGHSGPARPRFASLPNVETLTGALSRKIVDALQPDIIHIHHLRPLIHWYFRRHALSPYPMVVTVHGIHVRRYDFQRDPGSRLKSMIRRFTERKLYHRADRVIAVSREDREFLIRQYGLENVETVFNGIPAINPRSPTVDGTLEGLDCPKGGIVALVPARFDFQKGHDILINAVAHPLLSAHRHRMIFLLAGEGPLRRDMEAMALGAGVDDRFHFLGDCSHERILDLMRASDIVLLPSRWEGLPIALLEAGMLARPVLASDACGNREVLEERRGLIFVNGDPESLAKGLRGIIENPLILEGLGEKLRDHVREMYSLERMLGSLEALYENCLQG